MAKGTGIFKDKMFWILLGVIIIVSIIDQILIQSPAASPQEAVFEAVQIVSAIFLGIKRMLEEK